MRVENGISAGEIEGVVWIKSSASQGVGNCVEAGALPGWGVAVRNSRFPEGPALVFTQAEMRAFLSGAKAGEFDHLAG
ncbi:DUF397 domain-containing protein [Streptomyces silvisoli]|uniref:DUF397 domain-containing protein n=1 Tax=Streptomyces silvisoli TaxID=3034235 RepID=A0ABT5ZRC2_9ACTN|nr:DUF397 domain-containing protein [Streptomyces silvisoli]MDF3292380.1 DUF397 domain-containing protein [Streptomyces silvisoli]